MIIVFVAEKAVGYDGNMKPFAAFTRQEDAAKAVEGLGTMGVGDGKITPLEVFETFEEFTTHSYTSARDAAMAKLSDEEKKDLGLT